MFGHLPKSEVEKMKANFQASAKLYDIADKIPSWGSLADSWFASRVEGISEIWMGVDGAAINAENTKRTYAVNEERKPSRWSIRR